jgi:LPXTG-site transpeptidase (sortase) family protein
MFIQKLKKAHLRFLLLITFTVFFLLLLFYVTQRILTRNQYLKAQYLKSKVISKTSPVLPMRLTIPTVNVNANIQLLGVTSKGAMEVPSNAVDVGWFKLGPRPGEKGSAVIAGHFDGENGEAGVFINLYKLKKGDKLYTEDSKGKTIAFVVREKRTYDPGYADDVFSASDSAHLNLITCDGAWDGAKKSYNKRLVVFSDKQD